MKRLLCDLDAGHILHYDNGLRAIIALDLPNEINAEIQSIQDALRAVPAEVAWTKPENFHTP